MHRRRRRPIIAGCSGTPQEGLDSVNGIAISPDGRSVYATANNEETLVHFDRNRTTGALTGKECIEDTSNADCDSSTPGLGEIRHVAVSPDGKSVYVVSSEPVSTIVRFDFVSPRRDPRGYLLE